ncbi:MAG: TolC family protein [Myxococcota bacterium]
MARPLLLMSLGFLFAMPLHAEKTSTGPFAVEECVAIALGESARIMQAAASIDQYRARLAEVEAVFYPKLFGTGFVAPMFTVKFDDITKRTSTKRYKSIDDWGPYTKLEATLVQPIYTFGRAAAGKEAAHERMQVEQARLREVKNAVALEVRKLYYTYLYAQSMLPTLYNANKLIEEAERRAQKLYDDATGDVTQVDLMKLRYGATELAKFVIRGEEGAKLALEALKHTMGWPAEHGLQLKETRLDRDIAEEMPKLSEMIAEAAQNRPEWAQLKHGKRAALRLADAELLANAPVVFLAARFKGAWTPTRDDTSNPYHNDPYNSLSVGAALGINFDIDPWKSVARSDQAQAQHKELEALARFAETGIPLQVRLAYTDMEQARVLVDISTEGAKATKRWMTFAASAFGTGTGEAKDVLEGLAAYTAARNGEYENLRDYYIARAELDHAVGRAERP